MERTEQTELVDLEVKQEIDGSMEAANLSNNKVDMDDIDDIEQKGELEPLDMDTALRWPCTVCELKFISRGGLDKHMNLAHSGAVVGEVEEGTDMDIVVKACTVVGLAKESPRHEEDLFPTTSGYTHVVESEEEENNTAMEEGVRMEKPKAKKPDAKPAPKEESSSEESSSEGEKPKSAAKTVAATKEESSSVATKFPVVKTAAKKESSSEDSGSEEEEELEQSDEVNSNENESIVESIENIKNFLWNFLDDEETEDSALEIYPDEDDEEDEDREGQMENKNSLPESQLSRVNTPFHNKMDPLCVSLVQQHLDSIGSTLSDLFRTKYQPEKTDMTMEEVVIKWQDDFQLKNVAGYHSSPLAMPASLLCCLCNDPCCSVEDLRNHLRNTHGVKKEDLGEHIKKTMKEQIKEQESSAEVVTLDEDEDQEEIDVIEIVEVSDEDEDEDEVSFVSEHEGICMTAEEKEVFRKCFTKKKLLN